MGSAERKERLAKLINEYQELKKKGKLDASSEETVRAWLNEFLGIFDWDVRDSSQILQEKFLSPQEKEKLKEIGSQNTKPDYTFRIAKQKLSFLDAKNITVNILEDAEAAFQIKSYGWSIIAPCAFLSNFEEFAIYDCTYLPEREQPADLGRLYFTIDQYIDQFHILEAHLLKGNVYKGQLQEMYSTTLQNNKYIQKVTPDIRFAEQLSAFRLALASDILQNNPNVIGTNASQLSYVTQMILNRILFIRVCEGRKIEEEGLLLNYQKQGFWKAFKQSCHSEFYTHYDGPLFDRNIIRKIIVSDKLFDELLTLLYYPSPYRFDVIPTKLLSDIYELFLSRKLVIRAGVVTDALKSEYWKTKGAVSTPAYIVDEIIRLTIPRNSLLEGGIENLLSVKILDIACGSGAFVIGAYDYIEDIFKELYQRTQHPGFESYFFATGTEVIVNLAGKKAIMDHCIFGVDIDPEAVEVTKMSLSLKIIDSTEHMAFYYDLGIFGENILQGIGNNIRCGNSLVESDILTSFPSIQNEQEELLNTRIFDWKSEQGFKVIFDQKDGFDFIIGNPPYVEVKNYNLDLPYMHAYIKKKFLSSQNGKVDLAIPFIERAIGLLNPNGRIGFIVQKRFFKTAYGKKIREIITANRYLSSIIDFATTDIFKGRLTYVAILILDKNSPEHFTYKTFKESPPLLASSLRETPIPGLSPGSYITLPAAAISATPWNFDDNQLINIRTRLVEQGTFGNYADVKVGIQVLWDRAYHIRPFSNENGLIRGESHLEENIEIELDACRALICNENFYPYRKDIANVYVIFPYDVVDGNVTEIAFPEFESRFPLAGSYLRRNKATIEAAVETMPRRFPDKYNELHWHLYTRVQNHGATYPKVMVPMTALDTYASLSFSEKTYCDNANVFFIDVPGRNETCLYALSAVINSTIYSVLARSIANPQSNGYFKFNKQFLEPVPFPRNTFIKNTGIRIQLADTAQQIEALQQQYILASLVQKNIYGDQLATLWKTVDNLCYQLYGLNEEEIAFFETRGRNRNRIEILN